MMAHQTRRLRAAATALVAGAVLLIAASLVNSDGRVVLGIVGLSLLLFGGWGLYSRSGRVWAGTSR